MNASHLRLVLVTFFVATGGLLYEIFLGAFGSYLFADSVKVFSLTTGLYMFCMGVGAYAIKPNTARPLKSLLLTQLVLILLHVIGPLLVWKGFVAGSGANIVFWTLLIFSGTLVGTEVPLILALYRRIEGGSEHRVHQVLAADYFGALVASFLFGFILIRTVGLIGTAAVAAAAESCGAILLATLAASKAKRLQIRLLFGFFLFLCALFTFESQKIQLWLEGHYVSAMQAHTKIIHSEWSGFSFITVTEEEISDNKKDHVLFLDRRPQWNTRDLDEYHETVVFPAAESLRRTKSNGPERVLILGGGDGFAAEKLITYYQVPHIEIVDIDPRISHLARTLPFWKERGGWAVDAPQVSLHHEDAFEYVRNKSRSPSPQYDFVLMDLPDPIQPALARFFTGFFFSHLKKIMAPQSILSIQANQIPKKSGGRERHVCAVQKVLESQGFQTQVVIGEGYDYTILATFGKLHFPSDEQKFAGKFIKSGAQINAMLPDIFKLLGSHCPKDIPLNSLLIPSILEI